tara:strand:+ start:950 stop:1114 length:165 start_codon:yes stop_codon:yes gene_type:complete
MTVIASALKSPQRIVMDGDCSLLLAEQGRGRILRFTYDPPGAFYLPATITNFLL